MNTSLPATADLTQAAREIGTQHGRSAAQWLFDGNTSDDTYHSVLQGIDDDDPAVLDTYRTPDLSGEFADDYSEADLIRELGMHPAIGSDSYAELISEVSNAYNDAASEAFWSEVERIARNHVESAAISALQSASIPVVYMNRSDVSYGTLPPYQHYRSLVSTDTFPDAYADLSRIGKGDDTAGQSTTLDRSNYRSLIRDYPETFTPVSYANVNGLGAFIADLSPELVETLTGLASEYPVYDEEDMTELEQDEISEQWDDFAAHELGQELPEAVQDAWSELSADQQRDLFNKACQVSGYYPEHSGLDVHWSYAYERTVPFITSQLSGQS